MLLGLCKIWRNRIDLLPMRQKYAALLILSNSLLLLLLFAYPSWSQNAVQKRSDPFFDCTQAKNDVQRIICNDPTFIYEDQSLERDYRRLMDSLSDPTKQRVQREQSDWLKQRENGCAGGPDKIVGECVHEMHRKKSNDLYTAYVQAVCPNPDRPIMNTCQQIKPEDLPEGVGNLLQDAPPESGGWEYSTDLNGDGTPEYLACTRYFPHGPCGAVLIGQVRSKWRVLMDRAVQGYAAGCDNFFIIMESRTNGYHDICFPQEEKPIWKFNNGKYQPMERAKRGQ